MRRVSLSDPRHTDPACTLYPAATTSRRRGYGPHQCTRASSRYLFDHRNGSSLTAWFTEQYIGGQNYGLGNSAIDGFFLDDSWGDPNSRTPSNSTRPSEEAYPCSPRGTGKGRCANLTADETLKMTAGWQRNMDTVQAAIVEKGGFAWQSFRCIDGSHDGIACRPVTPPKVTQS